MRREVASMNGESTSPAAESSGPADAATDQVFHDEALHRFELTRDGVALAHLEYVHRTDSAGGSAWAFTHTWTEPAARGQGLAAKVVVGGLEAARAAGVGVIAVCPYVVDFLAAHAEYADLHTAGRP